MIPFTWTSKNGRTIVTQSRLGLPGASLKELPWWRHRVENYPNPSTSILQVGGFYCTSVKKRTKNPECVIYKLLFINWYLLRDKYCQNSTVLSLLILTLTEEGRYEGCGLNCFPPDSYVEAHQCIGIWKWGLSGAIKVPLGHERGAPWWDEFLRMKRQQRACSVSQGGNNEVAICKPGGELRRNPAVLTPSW